MPQRNDIKRILVIGSGPIVIGQAGEFDYSGSQAVKALKNLGYYVVVVNSNPATVMTDPELSDKTYIEPIETNIIEQIIKREKIDSILPTVGGQTALNVTLKLQDEGIIDKYNIDLLGVNTDSIRVAESRELFNNAMTEIGLKCPNGTICKTYDQAMKVPEKYNYPLIIRPSFTLGGTGGGVAHTFEEYDNIVKRGLELSPTNELLIEESLMGWKEYEYEVIRDINDNVIIIASVENFDPMGVHTGDSITVAPAQTLTDKEYQQLRDYSIDIIRKIGVATGGSNIQFGINPENGDVRIIEMNPRVSRSSALVSKATGFPIAKIAAQLAVGLTLDEITNEITGTTPASFEPTLDYIVVKIPRWDFEKFSVAPNLTTQMKSVGEVMSIGSNFREAIQKAYRSLEIDVDGLDLEKASNYTDEELKYFLEKPTPIRPFIVKESFKRGFSIDEIYNLSKIDKWFLDNILQIVEFEKSLEGMSINKIPFDLLKLSKLNGFSDMQLGRLLNCNETEIRNKRKSLKILPTYKKVDTCSAEFDAKTPYFYSTYLNENESQRSERKKIVVLGGGPFRIGQGIEFDYCASQASLILKEIGIETIMVNCNPETVSTDYDTSDKLYFEPVTYENVMDIIDLEKPDGIILQLGGQTPLNLSKRLKDEDIKILGTSYESINIAEDRGDFIEMLKKLDIPYPIGDVVFDEKSAVETAINIGFPVIVRPSYVLGGRGMEITYNEYEIKKYIENNAQVNKENPVLIDKYLENSIEIDVDAISDGEDFFISGIMQHIEEAGVHSGDSCSVLPAYQISDELLDEIKAQTGKLIKELKIIGFINIQFVIYRNSVYVIEVNPRASRTVPYVSKSIGIPLTKLSVMLMLDKKLSDYNIQGLEKIDFYSVKSPVFSFSKFPGVDTVLGPEMRSTGEVMGISEFFGEAYVKSQLAAGNNLPTSGNVFISVNDFDKQEIIPIAKNIKDLGFTIFCTIGTHNALKLKHISSVLINKIGAGKPDVIELMDSGDINLIINTPLGRKAYQDDNFIREEALQKKIHCITTLSAAKAAVEGIEWLQKNQIAVYGPVKDRIKIS
ncbi:carbamoyl-phosphate synthase large subunit [Candidatus Kapabacteria bacterium]|nr:carbamoyl-phosphate synthase large subunit [Candidatus Kapabacteria bacterium]